MSNTDTTKNQQVNSGAREEQAVAVSYKTHAMLLMNTVKSGKKAST
jgi:hypothetical protein